MELLWFIIWVLIYNVEASLVQSYFKNIHYIRPPSLQEKSAFVETLPCILVCISAQEFFALFVQAYIYCDLGSLQTPPFFNHFIVRSHCLVSKLLSMTKAEPYSCLLLLSEYRWITISPYRITTVGSCVLELVWKVTQVRNQSGHRWNSKYNANTKDKYKYEMLLKFLTKQVTNDIPSTMWLKRNPNRFTIQKVTKVWNQSGYRWIPKYSANTNTNTNMKHCSNSKPNRSPMTFHIQCD